MLTFKANSVTTTQQMPLRDFLNQSNPADVCFETPDFDFRLITVPMIGEEELSWAGDHTKGIGAREACQIANMGEM